MVYTRNGAFCNPSRNFGTGPLARGDTSKKKMRIPGALSLSLSSIGRENERRGRGELDPSQVQPPNFHFWSMCPLSGAGLPAHQLLSTFHYLPIHSMNPFAWPPVCVCVRHQWPSLLCHEPLLPSRSPTNPIPHNHITRGNSFVSAPHAVHAIEQILLHRWLDIEFFK